MTVTVNPFECKREHLTIRGEIYRAEGSGQPIAILCHGMMSMHTQMNAYARMLAEQGYAAFAIDFNGGGPRCKSDGKSEDMTVFSERDDIIATLRHVQKLSFTDSQNVTLVGASLGGFACALAAAELGDAVKNLVLLAPAFSFPDDMRLQRGMFKKQDPNNLPEIIQAGPMKLKPHFVTTIIACDVFHIIPKYKGRVLLLHGTADTTISPEYSVKAYHAYTQDRGLMAPSVDCQHISLEGAGHTFFAKHEKLALNLIRGFLDHKCCVLNMKIDGNHVSTDTAYFTGASQNAQVKRTGLFGKSLDYLECTLQNGAQESVDVFYEKKTNKVSVQTTLFPSDHAEMFFVKSKEGLFAKVMTQYK